MKIIKRCIRKEGEWVGVSLVEENSNILYVEKVVEVKREEMEYMGAIFRFYFLGRKFIIIGS